MTSPADELRAAATKLRETAAKATPGPRKAGRIAGIGHCVSAPDLNFCVAVEPGWVSKGDVEWIALASPALAEPLANWLEAEVVRIERVADPAWHEHLARYALAVARALNGGQQS